MQEQVVQTEPVETWVVVPGIYEKWVNPANKNDKHYRVIYRSTKGGRRIGDEQFKRASEALSFADEYNREVANVRSE